MWVIARNIGDPAWSEPRAGEAEATQEDVVESRDKGTKHRKPRRLKDAANQNTLGNRDPRKWKVPMSASLAQVPRPGFPVLPRLLRGKELISASMAAVPRLGFPPSSSPMTQ